MLRKINKRGAVLIEYIIILAFIASLAAAISLNGNDGLAYTAKNVAAAAKKKISIALGFEPDTKAKTYGDAQKYQAVLSQFVDGVYDYFQERGYTLASVTFSDDGGDGIVTSMRYWNADGTFSELVAGSDDPNAAILDGLDVNYFLEGSGYAYAKSDRKDVALSFDQNGNVERYGVRAVIDGETKTVNQISKLSDSERPWDSNLSIYDTSVGESSRVYLKWGNSDSGSYIADDGFVVYNGTRNWK